MNKHFPLEFQKALVNHEMDDARLARAMGRRGYGITKQFLGQVRNGLRNVSPESLRRICETLQCDEMERGKLHTAAARYVGYEI